jgi:hypothetical protein
MENRSDRELWIKNEADHATISAKLDALQITVGKTMDIIPVIFKWCVFPLIAILGGTLGAERILTKFFGGQ